MITVIFVPKSDQGKQQQTLFRRPQRAQRGLNLSESRNATENRCDAGADDQAARR
jgi:hypothetical protein